MSYKGSEWINKKEWRTVSVKLEKSVFDDFDKKLKIDSISKNKKLIELIKDYIKER